MSSVHSTPQTASSQWQQLESETPSSIPGLDKARTRLVQKEQQEELKQKEEAAASALPPGEFLIVNSLVGKIQVVAESCICDQDGQNTEILREQLHENPDCWAAEERTHQIWLNSKPLRYPSKTDSSFGDGPAIFTGLHRVTLRNVGLDDTLIEMAAEDTKSNCRIYYVDLKMMRVYLACPKPTITREEAEKALLTFEGAFDQKNMHAGFNKHGVYLFHNPETEVRTKLYYASPTDLKMRQVLDTELRDRSIGGAAMSDDKFVQFERELKFSGSWAITGSTAMFNGELATEIDLKHLAEKRHS